MGNAMRVTRVDWLFTDWRVPAARQRQKPARQPVGLSEMGLLTEATD